MKNLLLIIPFLLLLTGCASAGLETNQTENVNFQIDKLFTVEGCRVYRFKDNLRYHYITTCEGSVTGYSSCGKNCEQAEEIPTNKIKNETTP